jgi:hypothetical protein
MRVVCAMPIILKEANPKMSSCFFMLYLFKMIFLFVKRVKTGRH